jgi:homoprotocatechuate degradation regulator HpaR
MARRRLPPYPLSLAGTLLAAREAVMAPIRPFLRAAGVTEQQWRVLRVLGDDGGIDASRLADAALLHPPSVTRILRELVERGLVARRASPDDGRRAILVLEPEGRALVERTAVHTLGVLEAIGRRFGEARLAALRAELAALTAAIADLETPRPAAARARRR